MADVYVICQPKNELELSSTKYRFCGSRFKELNKIAQILKLSSTKL